MADANAYSLNINLLSSQEYDVVKCIIAHIEKGQKKVPVAQIAEENFVSTAFIYKMCKRLGFEGYSELFYYLMQAKEKKFPVKDNSSAQLITNYSIDLFNKMKDILDNNRGKQIYAIGKGLEEIVAEYIAQRLSLFGYSGFTNMMFYNNTFYKDQMAKWNSNNGPSFLIAVSQSGNTKEIVENVKAAKKMNYQIILFTRSTASQLSELSDIAFVVEPEKQNLVGQVPNLFHGKVVLAFEKLIAAYLMDQVPEEI